jgi:hypothetical protein
MFVGSASIRWRLASGVGVAEHLLMSMNLARSVLMSGSVQSVSTSATQRVGILQSKTQGSLFVN